MEVKRSSEKKDKISDYYLIDGDKKLKISFGGNLDLNWKFTYFIDESCLNEPEGKRLQEKFIITKENYYIYQLFDEIINDIKEVRIYEPIKLYQEELEESDQLNIFAFLESEEESKKRCQNWNDSLKNSYRYRKLYDGQTITWHSDADEYSIADRVKITKIEDDIVLEFIRPALIEDKLGERLPGEFSIRFNNSGSTYDPFNIVFMKMYNKLQEYDPDYHQIHIEEYVHRRKLQK